MDTQVVGDGLLEYIDTLAEKKLVYKLCTDTHRKFK